jgi:hypothetical protein
MPRKQRSAADGLAIRLGLRHGGDRLIEVGPAGEELLDRPAVFLVGPVKGGEGEVLAPQPGPVALGPVAPGPVHAAVPREELHQAVAPAAQILLDVLPAADQIADRFRRFIGHRDRRQLAGSEQANQLGRIPAVSLNAIPGFARGERRGDYLARHGQRGELPVQVVARRARLIAGDHLALALQPLEAAAHVPRLVRDRAEFGLRGLWPQDPEDDRAFAVIHGNVCGMLVHDRPPFACGSVPGWEQPTLLCDKCGRSFHMV